LNIPLVLAVPDELMGKYYSGKLVEMWFISGTNT